jgi:outer membrane receptor protein involved in Fe transport
MDNGLDMSLDARYSDAYHSEVVHKARGKTDPYWIANAELGYSLENVRVYATVKNLFDTQEPVLLSPGATPAADVAYLTDPRTLTVGLDFTF